ncbi:hypothetical protein LSUB1_G002853 [Lachnellula subtilissima]|uniref:Ubiquitin-like domain-containing protein n=1 Tax=Lachnellula subtilissima TaxID=602034 RepID=A0A8H8RRA3_9HELO|nr:hypothetical protein LSUB1_G002853 [Lachnellula subtilissima]
MAGFGWSVGDLVASLQLVVKIAGALKETGGAKSDYQESIEFLFGLETTLQNLRSVAPILVNQSQESAVQLEAQKIVKPLSICLAKIQKFDGALGLESKRNPWRTAPRKVQWAIFVSKEVKKLRDRISVPMFSLNILLQSQTLHAVSSLQERLPSDISERLASGIENAVSKGLRDELDSLRGMMGKYEVDSTMTPGDNSQEAEQTTQSLAALSPEQLPLSQPAGQSPDLCLNSRLEKLANDQLVEMKSLKRSLSTIIALQRLPRENSKLRDPCLSSTTPFSELKTTFAKCMVLLALSLRELFNSTLIYLGPHFLLFVLTFKDMGSRIPKMLLNNNSILFEDVLGRRKYLPIEFFQHYNVFNTFLRESFTGVPGQRYVLNQQYRLTDSRNELVDSTTWRKTITNRSKIMMSVMLEKLTEDEVSCPRCWMPESSTQLGAIVQCSSCSLIYTTNISVNVSAQTNQLDSLKASEAGTKDANLPSISSEVLAPENYPSGNEWTEAESSWISVKNNNPKGDDSPNSSGKPTALPWGSHQDLIHFKRVQVADLPNQKILPQSSALLQLLVVLSRMRDLIDYAISRSGTQHSMQQSLEAVLAQITNFTRMIHVFFEHQSFEVLKLITGRDWKTKTWSNAWIGSVRLSEKSKELISVARLVCRDLQRNYKIVTANEVFAQWNQTVTLFNIHSVALKGSLDLLKNIDDAWMSGGQRIRREVISFPNPQIDQEDIANDTTGDHGAATCLVVTPRYIIVALDNKSISIFDHKDNFLRNLQGHQTAVWTMAVHVDNDEILVSGGAGGVDRNVHVWDMSTG